MNRFVKIAISVALLAIGAVLGSKDIMPYIAPNMFEKVVAERFASNPSAELEDGLHVILIGTGSPLADPTRAGPSTAIIEEKALYAIAN